MPYKTHFRAFGLSGAKIGKNLLHFALIAHRCDIHMTERSDPWPAPSAALADRNLTIGQAGAKKKRHKGAALTDWKSGAGFVV